MHDIVLASGPHMVLAADFFKDTTLGQAITALMHVAAILIVLVAAVKGVKDVLAGKAGKAAQLVIGAAVIVAFLWDPSLITKLIDLASNLVGKGVDTTTTTVR